MTNQAILDAAAIIRSCRRQSALAWESFMSEFPVFNTRPDATECRDEYTAACIHAEAGNLPAARRELERARELEEGWMDAPNAQAALASLEAVER